ncbi:small_GTPase [Nesidiocoris tenuis]|uniref:small monomeric GTPase n=1 Tax=Nesidiocoris tenuis TaxID=355587 RepID=A0ABN7AAL3_9HEMI|nr:small_GTPase [Nesidiocoris tenuis]
MKTEERSSNSPRVRILVLGMINVGKSALTVRYLTRRYIGEYRSNTDLLYRQTVTINNAPVEVEIIDVSGETRDSSFPSEQVQWADGCVIVYSITDRLSFQYATEALDNLNKIRAGGASVPVTLLGNKADLAHLRTVTEDEGRKLGARIGCPFHEVSVAENSTDLYAAFETLLNETKNQLGKSRKFSVTKMIGTLISSAKSHPPPVPQGGTVVVCHKSDLHKSRVLKRRQNFTATASL